MSKDTQPAKFIGGAQVTEVEMNRQWVTTDGILITDTRPRDIFSQSAIHIYCPECNTYTTSGSDQISMNMAIQRFRRNHCK